MRASGSRSRSPRSRYTRTDWSVSIGHGDECVAAARRREASVLFGDVEPVDRRNARAALRVDSDIHSQQLQIRRVPLTDEHSRVTQRAALQSMSMICRSAVACGASRATRCRCVSVPPANWHVPHVPLAHEKSVRVFHVAHTLRAMNASRVVYTSRRSPALSRTRITRTTPFS